MNRQSFSIVLLVAAALTLMSLVTLQGQNTAKPRATAAAVVDVQKVFNALKEKGEVEAEMTRRGESVQKETQERTQEIEALKADLPVLNPGSEAFQQTTAKLKQKAVELKVWRELEMDELARESAIRMEGLYLKIVKAIERKAKKDGYDLVFYKDPVDNARGQNQQQVREQIVLRKVLYSAPELDITDQITQMLNNEFDNPGKKK